MKKNNLLVLGLILACIALVAAIALLLPDNRTIAPDAPSVAVDTAATDAPEATQEPTAVPVTDAPEATQEPTVVPATDAPEATQEASVATASDAQATDIPEVKAYLILTVQGNIYEPLPLTGEGTFTLRQDETTYNTVHITPTSVWMEHSSCDNQDCVDQGVVSLENMTSRVLYNMVICLPNQVSLELHTPETLRDAFGFALSEE